jgi:hypothetical protein
VHGSVDELIFSAQTPSRSAGWLSCAAPGLPCCPQEEYADQTTLESRLLEVVRRVMQKPNGHKPSNADQLLAALNQTASLATPDAYAAAQPAGVQLMVPVQQQAAQPVQQQGAAAGGQLQAGAAFQLQQQQQQQQQQAAAQLAAAQQAGVAGLQAPNQALMLGAGNGLLSGGGLLQGQAMLNPASAMVPQQSQVPQQVGNAPLLMNGGLIHTSQLAGAPAGGSTADSMQRAGVGEGGTPGSGMPPSQPSFSMLLGGAGSGAGTAMMSNGAPVLLRSGGLGAGGMVPCTLPMQTGVLNGVLSGRGRVAGVCGRACGCAAAFCRRGLRGPARAAD